MAIGTSRVYRGLADYFLRDEANVHISVGLSQRTTWRPAPRPSQLSLAQETSGTPVGLIFETDSLPPQNAISVQERMIKFEDN